MLPLTGAYRLLTCRCARAGPPDACTADSSTRLTQVWGLAGPPGAGKSLALQALAAAQPAASPLARLSTSTLMLPADVQAALRPHLEHSAKVR